MSKLSIRNLSKQFHRNNEGLHALSDINLEVNEGEFLMLAGPSGCGKSTLLNIIAGLEKADSGEVQIDGVPVTGPGPDRCMVFQDGALFPWLDVLRNVEFGLKQAGVGQAEGTERAKRAICWVGLENFEKHSIHQLSGGMRQRVAIARSLVLEPKVILMDEPFSALDAITREDLYGALQNLWSEQGTTFVCVTHNTREAVTLGDRVVLMSPRPGRIQEIFPVNILRPRHIDDIDVSMTAKRISTAMKNRNPSDLSEPC